MMTIREAKAARVDAARQERGPHDARVSHVAPHLLHRVHPETGLDVVFIAGELLPDWVEVSADD
jgi:hypothetical protein